MRMCWQVKCFTHTVFGTNRVITLKSKEIHLNLFSTFLAVGEPNFGCCRS